LAFEPHTIGLISDIHANLPALRRALALLHEHGVDHILCAGDLVEKGPDGNAVVTLLRDEGIPCVMGNHDFDVVGNQAWLRENGDLLQLSLNGRLLTEETLAYLKKLPPALSFVWQGKRIFLAHGAPWSANEYIFANNPPHVFTRVAFMAQADAVILGHTHMPMCVQAGTTRILNPGAVSGGRGDPTCGILTLPDLAFEVYNLVNGRPVDFGNC
jgi:putative phosphoesterase